MTNATYRRTARFALWAVLMGGMAGTVVSNLPSENLAKSGPEAPLDKRARTSIDPPGPAVGKLCQDLFLAIDHRDQAELESLLKRGGDPNSANGLGFGPLFVAAASHQPKAMAALIEAGAKPDAQTMYGTPLMFAATSAHLEGAQMLLAKGANVNASRDDGMTVLMMASYTGHPGFVGELLKRKADPNAKDDSGVSALSLAARAGNVPVVQMLVQADAKIDDPDNSGQTPLMAAAQTGRTEIVDILLKAGAKANLRDGQGRTALMLAASYGDYPGVVKALLAAGANKGATDFTGRSAAALAASHGYTASSALLGKPSAATLAATGKPRSAGEAVGVSLKLVQSSMKAFTERTNCVSCHQEGLGRIATGAAKERGYTLDQGVKQAHEGRLNGMVNAMKPLHQAALQSPEAMKQIPLMEINEISSTDTWLLSGMAAHRQPATEATAAMAMVLARQQLPDGRWSYSLPREPMQSSAFTFTALAIRSLQAYGPKAHSAEIAERIERAKAWLLKAEPKNSKDRASRLLGLKWAGASEEEQVKSLEEIRADQRPDGGWAQLPNLNSDAYATGQALYALRQGGGMSTSDPVYATGVKYLLRTQDKDGSWFVNKRTVPSNNYFGAKFPHGQSQYASFNGTCWAILALLETLPAKGAVASR